MTTELESYLPSIEKARAQGLDIPAVPPQQESRCAALIVMARAVRRDFWDEVVPAERVDASVPIGPAPEPADYETRMLARVLGPAARGVRIRHYTDTGLSICDMHVPTLPEAFAYESALEQLAGLGTVPPECLRCHDLTPKTAGESAYRGGGKPIEPGFHGFAFGDALDKARSAVERMGVRGSIYRRQVLAWAWPFLWLHYPKHVAGVSDIIVTASAQGTWTVIDAPAPG